MRRWWTPAPSGRVSGEILHSRCAVDALMLATTARGRAQVESESRVSGHEVAVRMITDGTVRVAPPAAVFCYGVAWRGDTVPEALGLYLLAFASTEEYEQRVRRTSDAVSLMLTLEGAVALAGRLAAGLQECWRAVACPWWPCCSSVSSGRGRSARSRAARGSWTVALGATGDSVPWRRAQVRVRPGFDLDCRRDPVPLTASARVAITRSKDEP